ncbi:D-arabinono-1,4-lactone oxidase [Salinithrix halophila]|uniref:D-arabinono-1,4-lactone oxidase n=1 Tax=Salinithrix halophila TaxID=1485204 RepID=A0ABV8JMQ7_9BACL
MNTSVRRATWTNWAGSVCCMPSDIIRPSTPDEAVELVRRAASRGQTLRAVGSGHSFTPLAETDQVLVSLDGIQGLIGIDAGARRASVRAGTKLAALGIALEEGGWAMENMGDIDAQTIAGAVSTGTHGTGIRFGTLSDQVEGVTLVTAEGEIITCSPDTKPDWLQGARLSLGALGLIIGVDLRVRPRYLLRMESRRMGLEEVLASLDHYKREHRHFEFFWFPYTDSVQAKFLDETKVPSKGRRWWGSFSRTVLENGVYWCLSESARYQPRLCAAVSRISARGIPTVKEIGMSRRVFVTPRKVRFCEMEYSIPADALPDVLREMKVRIEEERHSVHFPVECRFVRGEDIWLSPAYGRDSAYVAVHMYKGMEWRSYFRAMEEIFLRYEGRPHWGKMHSLEARDLEKLYPRWQDFQYLREHLDPRGLFLNPYLKRIFGV